jgi:hypothetical protein
MSVMQSAELQMNPSPAADTDHAFIFWFDIATLETSASQIALSTSFRSEGTNFNRYVMYLSTARLALCSTHPSHELIGVALPAVLSRELQCQFIA